MREHKILGKVYTVREIADLADVKPWYLSQLIKQGAIPRSQRVWARSQNGYVYHLVSEEAVKGLLHGTERVYSLQAAVEILKVMKTDILKMMADKIITENEWFELPGGALRIKEAAVKRLQKVNS